MEITIEYLEHLKGGFYKCLCLFEEKNDGLSRYISSFSYELYGLQYLMKSKKEYILTLLCVLEHFYDDSLEAEPDIGIIRSEAFRCMSLIEDMFKVGDVIELCN